jgi:acetyltransferase-like isoleucine patch superfamily enzyme
MRKDWERIAVVNPPEPRVVLPGSSGLDKTNHTVRRRLPGPTWLWRAVRAWLERRLASFKQPRMIWGHHDSTGQWRPRTRISDTVAWYAPERIKIADHVFIGHHCLLDGTGGIDLDEGVQLAAGVAMFTHSSHISIRLYGPHYADVPERDKVGYQIAPVRVGRYTFLGAGALIMPGVTIGKGALIAARAVVKRPVADFQIVDGNPATVVGDTRVLDARYLRDPQLKAFYDEWTGPA